MGSPIFTISPKKIKPFRCGIFFCLAVFCAPIHGVESHTQWKKGDILQRFPYVYIPEYKLFEEDSYEDWCKKFDNLKEMNWNSAFFFLNINKNMVFSKIKKYMDNHPEKSRNKSAFKSLPKVIHLFLHEVGLDNAIKLKNIDDVTIRLVHFLWNLALVSHEGASDKTVKEEFYRSLHGLDQTDGVKKSTINTFYEESIKNSQKSFDFKRLETWIDKQKKKEKPPVGDFFLFSHNVAAFREAISICKEMIQRFSQCESMGRLDRVRKREQKNMEKMIKKTALPNHEWDAV